MRDFKTAVRKRGAIVIPAAIRKHAAFVEGQVVRLIEATPRTLILTVDPDVEGIRAAIEAQATATTSPFPRIAARLAAGSLEVPSGPRRRQTVVFDEISLGADAAARAGGGARPPRRDSGRRATDLPPVG